ncbi:Adenine phosphoribosyltransferase [Enhygromyxa salina]|uniref:Adenine phosphoribosyltransferase n=1 Tax=Enhygromyxa salina TaxID=215803 RepID=A0A0C2CM21_9BACT|nr:adenine phosphoribosyltransferase [Enhygromyxa salina]KIG12281.1 Adenine phosphoribosyltransferase [Enhygromyxa salina]
MTETNTIEAIDPGDHARLLRELQAKVRAIPDFPSDGILFRDITPVLADPATFASAVDLHLHQIRDLIGSIDAIVGMEARGFWFGPILAHRLGIGFVPARKPGKLPAPTIAEDYALEYASNTLQLHADALSKGARVLIVDDLLATGGTAAAATALIERLGGKVVAQLFMIELLGLGGRARQGDVRVEAMLQF